MNEQRCEYSGRNCIPSTKQEYKGKSIPSHSTIRYRISRLKRKS